jgi:glycosyltransferase involved in cell wall biosynthesis
MVRFWRNVAALPAGNLMTREVDQTFTSSKQMIFDTAKAIITNTYYSRKVIERWQPTAKGKVHVCYVPVMGEFEQSGDEKGALTIVTPEIYGELNLVRRLSEALPNERFLIVNAQYYNASQFKEIENVTVRNYMEMDEVWSQTKALLVPVYENDVCGTRRTTIEAMRNGVPVIALNRCGMDEKVPSSMRVPGNATYQQWIERIKQINENYQTFQKLAKSAWEQYDTQKELERFEQILMQ